MRKFKNVNFYKFFILSAAFLISIFFILSAVNEQVKPVNHSYNFMPAGNNSFIYLKDFPQLKNQFLKSDIANKFKDNYLYLDFKFKYSQDVDLFFVKYNINIEQLFDLLKRDVIIGKNNDEYYLIASVSVKTKLIYSILNILPEQQIKDLNYNNKTISYVNKGGGTVYFSLIDDYMIISSKTNVIQSMIDSYVRKDKVIKEDLYTLCDVNDIYIYSKPDNDYNKYRLLPNIADISMKINIKEMRTKLEAYPGNSSEYSANNGFQDLNILKNFSKDFNFIYYSNLADVGNIISSFVMNTRVSEEDAEYFKLKDKAYSSSEVFNDFYDGAYFALNTFRLSGRSGISPELCSIVKLKDKVDEKKTTESLIDVFNFFFGINDWEISKGANYEKYSGRGSDFTMLKQGKVYYFIFGKKFADETAVMMDKPQPSLYDRYFEKLKSSPSEHFICINPGSFANCVEPVFKEYLSSKVRFTPTEYQNGFGEIFSYMNSMNPVFINMAYNPKKMILSGNVENVK